MGGQILSRAQVNAPRYRSGRRQYNTPDTSSVSTRRRPRTSRKQPYMFRVTGNTATETHGEHAAERHCSPGERIAARDKRLYHAASRPMRPCHGCDRARSARRPKRTGCNKRPDAAAETLTNRDLHWIATIILLSRHTTRRSTVIRTT